MSSKSKIPNSGYNILNFAQIDASGNVSNIQNSVKVTFDGSTDFIINGQTYTYDYTWGRAVRSRSYLVMEAAVIIY
ncbi:hypothetical protein [Acetobacter pasteurianus]|uniref:hypothetical protein n=1 Tax=Acetobacter TaxID=434 RepID=UPI000A89C28A|nr:hypothetical protein [Acetobacter pasteurianus]